jgi:ADP-ribosyl-[dinitrogen reductase] hydrolase
MDKNYFSKHIDYKRRYLNLKGGGVNKDLIRGVIWGVICGDCSGIPFEFMENSESRLLLDSIISKYGKLQLIGKGPFNLKAAQPSDDSEMTICLLYSIITKGKYNQNHVAKQYIKWFNSTPPDIGLTIKRSLFTRKPSLNAKDMVENSKTLNISSLSNGVLMRITPLAIIGISMSDEELKKNIDKECDLTHPNEIIKDVAFVYCIAIKNLLLNKDRNEVYNICYDIIKTPRMKIVLGDSKHKPEPIYSITDRGECFVNTDDKQFQGYVGIALQNAFYELLNGNTFYDSMINIIKRGGDTDTNCAIAGGLLGAFYGYKNIDQEWISSIKNVDRGVKFIAPSQVDIYIDELIKLISK